jgi:hypothetical protein
MVSQNRTVAQNNVNTTAASQSATISFVMIARRFKSLRVKSAIGPLASGHERVNDRLPLRQLVRIPMGCRFAFGQHSGDETKVAVFKCRRLFHSSYVATIHNHSPNQGLFPIGSSRVSFAAARRETNMIALFPA